MVKRNDFLYSKLDFNFSLFFSYVQLIFVQKNNKQKLIRTGAYKTI